VGRIWADATVFAVLYTLVSCFGSLLFVDGHSISGHQSLFRSKVESAWLVFLLGVNQTRYLSTPGQWGAGCSLPQHNGNWDLYEDLRRW